MIIADIDHIEAIAESPELKGGRRRSGDSDWSTMLQPLLQSLTIYPAAAASVNNLGGTSIGNTAIALNISMPILIAIGGLSMGGMGSLGGGHHGSSGSCSSCN